MITKSKERVKSSYRTRAHNYGRPIENSAIIEEEERGSGEGLMHYHVSEIHDPEVRDRIMQLSVLEIIS